MYGDFCTGELRTVSLPAGDDDRALNLAVPAVASFGEDSATGDGGGGDDPLGNAQNLGSLLGKILRIDP